MISVKKIKTNFICQECGYKTPKWLGQCPGCSSWNTMVEEIEERDSGKTMLQSAVSSRPLSLKEIEIDEEERHLTGLNELDRVLGGGAVKGSLILVGGDPGIGKSTLLLQVSSNFSARNKKVLYVSGEESSKQIKIRAQRLNIDSSNLYVLTETNLNYIEKHVQDVKPDILVVDSIQTIYKDELQSAPGSISQVRESTLTLMKIAKGLMVTTFIVGHVTKEGAIAGPRVLEHMVDTVLYFEGEKHQMFRIVRAVKNRFGSTNEMGIFEMKDKGLEEVINPSELLLSGRPENMPGSCVVCTMEGTRPVLVEIQALTSATGFGMPRRMATGFDYNRVILLMAVLEKRVGMQLQTTDAYVNVVGGIKLDEPACDLAIACAIASSFRNAAVDEGTVVFGEMGLTGEIRGISNPEKRIMEVQKLGFRKCVVPYDNYKALDVKFDIKLIPVKNIYEALDEVLGG